MFFFGPKMVLSPDNTAWDDLELRYLVSTDISHISQKMVTMATNRQLEILSYFFGRAPLTVSMKHHRLWTVLYETMFNYGSWHHGEAAHSKAQS